MEIEVKQVLLQLLNFGILVAVLGKFIFQPIIKILDQRSKKIADGLAAAENNLKAAAEIEKKQAEKLAEATKKAAALIGEAKAEGKKLTDSMLEEAKAAGAAALDKQRELFRRELEGEELALKKRLTSLIVETTKAVLKDTLKPADLKAITAKEIGKLK